MFLSVLHHVNQKWCIFIQFKDPVSDSLYPNEEIMYVNTRFIAGNHEALPKAGQPCLGGGSGATAYLRSHCHRVREMPRTDKAPPSNMRRPLAPFSPLPSTANQVHTGINLLLSSFSHRQLCGACFRVSSNHWVIQPWLKIFRHPQKQLLWYTTKLKAWTPAQACIIILLMKNAGNYVQRLPRGLLTCV